MNWDDLRIFRAVMETGGFLTAAEALGLSAGTVRRHMARLEDLVGASLFTHSPAGLVPTAAARALTPATDRMAGAAAAFRRAASAEVDALAGRVRVVVEPFAWTGVLPGLWDRLRAEHPALSLEFAFAEDPSGVACGDDDIGVFPDLSHFRRDGANGTDPALSRRSLLARDELDARWACSFSVCAYAHRDLVEEFGAPRSPADLVRLPMVGDYEAPLLSLILAGSGVDPDALEPAYLAPTRLSRFTAVEAGVGWGLAPTYLAERSGVLVRLLPEVAISLDFWVLARADLIRLRRVAVIRDAVIDHLRRELATPLPAQGTRA